MKSYNKEYQFVKENFISHNYSTCVKEASSIIENLFKEVYQEILFQCNHEDRVKLMEIEKEIGKGNKAVNNFTLGEIIGLYRKGSIISRYEKISGKDLEVAKSYSLNWVVNVRNGCTHKGYVPSKFETQCIIQCLLVLLVSFDKIIVDETDYMFQAFEEKKKIRALEAQLVEYVENESTKINMYPIDEKMSIWREFVGNYYAWNPSWQTESIFNEDEWFQIHKNRFENENVKTVEYAVSQDSTCGNIFPYGSDYFGIRPFINYMKLLNEKIPQVGEKLRIYVSEDLNSRITYFYGKTTSGVRSIILLNEPPFSNGEYPNYAFVSNDLQLYRQLKLHFDGNRTKFKRYRLSELLEAYDKKEEV